MFLKNHKSINFFKPILGIIIGMLLVQCSLMAQKEGSGKTIEITSTFKPSLIPPKKITPGAKTLLSANNRPAMSYTVPQEKLVFKFTPSPLKPLAYTDTAKPVEDRGYVKAGFGNFSTLYLKGAVNYGNGTNTNGNLSVDYLSSKGKLPFQQFTKYGIHTNTLFQVNENHTLQARVGFTGQNLFRYGYQPDSLIIPKDSLKLNYKDIHAGFTIGNREANDFGIYYKATADAHFFSDNQSGNETALHYEVPLEKELNEKVKLVVGLQGVLSKVSTQDTSYSNNLTILKAGASIQLTDQIELHAALLPTWNQGDFALLPQIEMESFIPEKNLVLQAGIKGGFVENTWRNVAAFNPWIGQPSKLIHSRNTEYYVAIKSVVNEEVSFRIKGNYQRKLNVPLFVNDGYDGRTFKIIWEPTMNIVGANAELVVQKGQKMSWTNQLTLQSYSGLSVASKPFGLLPFEFNSSLRLKLMDKLIVKADMYHFSPLWFNAKGDNKKGDGALDLNAGAEFDVMPKIKLWLQFNNLFNNTYQRWNQYQVLGFQAVGGVIMKF